MLEFANSLQPTGYGLDSGLLNVGVRKLTPTYGLLSIRFIKFSKLDSGLLNVGVRKLTPTYGLLLYPPYACWIKAVV
jgi:hypothetical protein